MFWLTEMSPLIERRHVPVPSTIFGASLTGPSKLSRTFNYLYVAKS